MGLDNIPVDAPCVKAGTARFVVDESGTDGVISCQATQDVGGCPWLDWMNETDRGLPTYGMIGAECWFRGKSGVTQLALLTEEGYELPEGTSNTFYGDADNYVSPEACRELGEWMKDHVDAYAKIVGEQAGQHVAHGGELHHADIEDELRAFMYAANWLVWVAEAGNGAMAWW
jgi:hypothetical protein